jgi:hypothetical protein
MTRLQDRGWGWLERRSVALLTGWSALLGVPPPPAGSPGGDAGPLWSELKALHGVRHLSLLPSLSGPAVAGGAALSRGGGPPETVSETPG